MIKYNMYDFQTANLHKILGLSREKSKKKTGNFYFPFNLKLSLRLFAT